MTTTATEGATMGAKTLRTLRLEKGWSLRELADVVEKNYGVKVDHGQLGRIERGDTKTPFPGLRAALCDLFDLDIAYFDRDHRT